ncbi:hypothetical protein [Streptomyces paromomycinus]|uniref:Uncharacterized protein n=1 Tax=Streptomyces paromomycinus TaxID=92743 RepID=A0A401W8S8_STREY|nr:hypothetical protein [Streptomyces paromomycinus]GCD45711.1 hypothetical protein GKJPGBOP_05449 [Streptomyces paromomycinus]
MTSVTPNTHFQAVVNLETADGELVTYYGVGYGPDDESGQQVLDGAERAALAEEPGGSRVTSSRVWRA